MRGKRVFAVIMILLAFCVWMSMDGYAASITIDGSVTDWGIDLSSAENSAYLDSHVPGKVSVDYITEDNTDINDGWFKVDPGWSYNNDYDAEAIYFDNDAEYGYIAIITGVAPDSTWEPGDIGLDVSPSEVDLVDQDSSATGASQATTPYEYGIELIDSEGNDGVPDQGALRSVRSWYNVRYDDPNSYDFTNSDPWAISESASTIDDDLELTYSSSAIEGHYVIETRFLLSDLGLSPGDEFNIHWTMQCGNDFLTLKAKVDPVPEPGTILLVGTGLLGLAMSSGRKKWNRG